jgi:hypothetical protein
MHVIRCSKMGAEPGGPGGPDSQPLGTRITAFKATVRRNHRRLGAAACLFAGAFVMAAVIGAQEAPVGSPDRPYLMPEANRPLDANQKMLMQEQQQKKANFEAANAERKKQLTDDSAHLLKLANELKTEVDKTDKDTLSISVIRKADEIERLARVVKEKMKLTVGAN